MKAILTSLICLTVLVAIEPDIYAMENCAEPVYSEEKNYTLGVGNALLSNLALFSVNRFIGQTEFSKISMESIHNNLTCPWQWDRSMFLVNQLGHPYQGYAYYAAARANNLNAFESSLVSALGSYTWEVFGERATAAVNDLIVTTVGGISLGEMLHRIYLDTYTENQLLATFISPMDSFNDWVSEKKQRPTHSRIQNATLSFGGGYVQTQHYRNNEKCDRNSYHTGTGSLGIDLNYGDPFVSHASSIFSHFDLQLFLEGGYNWYNLVLISDGALLSASLRPQEHSWTSCGLHLHYDVFSSKLMDFSGNSLTFTMQHERYTSSGCVFKLKAHAGCLLFGSSTFYRFETEPSKDSVERRDYGVGAASKLRMSWDFPRAGTISMQTAGYLMTTLPNMVSGSEGNLVFSRSTLAWKYPLNGTTSVGAANTLSWKKTDRDYLPDQNKRIYNATVFMEYKL
ncbi:hypothetical protein B4O97_11440 [Marispirochaeta aestuarii]|uniref:DUF3943 domain-containing protein n=1 Tax=Marispirochaeta aestuarii TaxID=1963862 RepID=A0A1Y1RYS2_9SPIO|nr:hypothetical protein B4O97_11440 [Marispirochaeta aestuarii]